MQHRVLIYGGRGALGSKIVETFKNAKWWACNIDMVANDNADFNVVVQDSNDWQEQAKQVDAAVAKALNNEKADAILCVAGGWAGGNAGTEDFVQSCDRMWKQSVWTSVIAAHLAAHHLKEDGLFQLTGAKAALDATPTMIGYGIAKAAVHHLVQSLRSKRGGLKPHSTTVAILPQLLDWAENKDKRPANGSLVQLITKGGQTDLIIGQLQQPTSMANY